MDRLPPLKAVQVFDTTARRLSFSKAAEELCVTQSAVSHQIKLLEQFMGKALFVRKGKRVALTHDGEIFFSVTGDCLQRISSVTNHLIKQESLTLKIAAQTSFASEWLAERVVYFQGEHPAIQVALDTHVHAGSFTATEYDILIGAWPQPEGFLSKTLKIDRWYPVCTPKLFEKIDVRAPESLLQHPLFSSEKGEDWNLWIQNQQIARPASLDIRHFNLALLTSKAALSGLGIALSNDFLAAEAIKQGRLKAITELSYTLPWGHYSVHYRTGLHRSSQITAFVSWLEARSAKLLRAM